MANRVPFTAYMRIVPERGSGKRFEIHRSRQKFAHLVHQDLKDNFSDGNIADPGGGQTASLAVNGIDSNDPSSFSNQANGGAVVPQFGGAPDTVIINGFYDGSTVTANAKAEATPYGEKKLIHSGGNYGESTSGPAAGAPSWNNDTRPTATAQDIVRNLKSDLETSITSVAVEIIKLEVQGVLYGHGGLHFPRP